MYNLLIVLGIIVCIWQFFLAKKGKVKTSLFIAILFSVIVILMILGELATLKLFVIVIAIILWVLSIWAFTKK
ncbi:hypothetical protein [Terrihalobacillus insolitus]|uniref:hypothetical protein n=1 Tax=Terrihalobacillus insolitus TaxID=2950438 RepID=UPI0023414D80|nr:hypothetical protein [Terrihalobacillus insolitus]MDC3413174.1 hypothetical protein [Terrihalobacillus insolitus]